MRDALLLSAFINETSEISTEICTVEFGDGSFICHPELSQLSCVERGNLCSRMLIKFLIPITKKKRLFVTTSARQFCYYFKIAFIKSKNQPKPPKKGGGPRRSRTFDHPVMSRELYQLSYRPSMIRCILYLKKSKKQTFFQRNNNVAEDLSRHSAEYHPV